ncbi:XF1762 family protein [Desulfoluna butyratoxydans]|uniref:Acyl-coa n-acyltransferase n=1 Tax=Desulfoluna butyratoxydans TaxID=231438 RepID=A0A4U8YU09_9BACT|nr:acyl-coa n-acyltransferase [Desulfoluna butyratoxydans]
MLPIAQSNLENHLSKHLKAQPFTIKKANEFIKSFHRHHRPTIRNNGRWAIAAIDSSNEIVGVVIAGNPVSATYMDGFTIELTRLCTKEGAPKGTGSFLLSRCCSIWRTMGGKRIITYTLESESGASLRGAGWTLAGTVPPHNRWQNKSKADGIKRADLQIYQIKKLRWEKTFKEVG